jgi:protease-4
MLQRIAADPNTRGVLLEINGLAAGVATLQSLRDELALFRQSGKRVVAYLLSLDNASYYVACAADEIITPPTAQFLVVGIRAEIQFLKDALAKFGIDADVEAVSPYKSAYDTFVRSDISPENRAQLERLLDQRFAELIRGIAQGRGKREEDVQALIDSAPLTGSEALEHGLVDALRYEDELPEHLHVSGEQAVILDWNKAQRALLLTKARFFRRVVGVVPIEGTITSGGSRTLPVPLPLFGGQQAGSDSVAQALRQAERNPRIAAVVVYVNSGGGDAFASDLMWREVLRVRQKKPVVVVMGDVAASGGYYLAAPASLIIAQPGTVTGSIGVVTLRPIVGGLLERAGINTVVLSRGAHSGLLSISRPPTEEERQAVRRSIFSTYEEFKRRVREGRGLSDDQLEPIAGGRVWLGAEAQNLGLVDQLGGIPAGLVKAQELARLPQDRTAPLALLRGGRGTLSPQPFPTNSVAEVLEAAEAALRVRVWTVLPFVGLY